MIFLKIDCAKKDGSEPSLIVVLWMSSISVREGFKPSLTKIRHKTFYSLMNFRWLSVAEAVRILTTYTPAFNSSTSQTALSLFTSMRLTT